MYLEIDNFGFTVQVESGPTIVQAGIDDPVVSLFICPTLIIIEPSFAYVLTLKKISYVAITSLSERTWSTH